MANGEVIQISAIDEDESFGCWIKQGERRNVIDDERRSIGKWIKELGGGEEKSGGKGDQWKNSNIGRRAKRRGSHGGQNGRYQKKK